MNSKLALIIIIRGLTDISNCVDALKILVWHSKKIWWSCFAFHIPVLIRQVYFAVTVQKIIDLEGSDMSGVSPDHKCQVVGSRGSTTCCVIFLTTSPSYNIFKMVHNESHNYQSPCHHARSASHQHMGVAGQTQSAIYKYCQINLIAKENSTKHQAAGIKRYQYYP